MYQHRLFAKDECKTVFSSVLFMKEIITYMACICTCSLFKLCMQNFEHVHAFLGETCTFKCDEKQNTEYYMYLHAVLYE